MNNYHIYEEVGKGSHTVVYKGRQKKTLKYVAIKCVEKNQKPRVLNEVGGPFSPHIPETHTHTHTQPSLKVKILHTLSHPNVVKFTNWYETTNHLWLIVQLLSGTHTHTHTHTHKHTVTQSHTHLNFCVPSQGGTSSLC